MKKVLLITLFTLILFLLGCSNEDQNSTYELKETKEYSFGVVSIYSSKEMFFDEVPEKIKIVLKVNEPSKNSYQLMFEDTTKVNDECISVKECTYTYLLEEGSIENSFEKIIDIKEMMENEWINYKDLNTKYVLVGKMEVQSIENLDEPKQLITFNYEKPSEELKAYSSYEIQVMDSPGLVCTSFVYSSWSECLSPGIKYRSIMSSLPDGCKEGNPVLSKICPFVFACVLSDWNFVDGNCLSNGKKIRTWEKINSCSGGITKVNTEEISCNFEPQPCVDFNYSSWSTCSSSQIKTRTVVFALPSDCVGGEAILWENCSYTPECTLSNWTHIDDACQSNGKLNRTWSKIGSCFGGVSKPGTEEVSCNTQATVCTSFSYSNWGECLPGGVKIREIVSSTPINCEGGNPSLFTDCVYTPTCTLSDWSFVDGACQSNNSLIRNWTKVGSCSGGITPINPETISCTYTYPVCTSFTYSNWTPSVCPESATQTRTIQTQLPPNCQGGDAILSQSCNYVQNCVESDWTQTDGVCQSNGKKVRTWSKVGACTNGVNKPGTEEITCNYYPKLILVADFDNGGEGIGYHDSDSTNVGGEYKQNEGVDITMYDTIPVVGWNVAGEWLKYTINTDEAGEYNISFRLASAGSGASFKLLVNNLDATGAISVPNTGSWTTFTTVTKKINLVQGQNILKLEMVAVSASGSVAAFKDMNISKFVPSAPSNSTCPATTVSMMQHTWGVEAWSNHLYQPGETPTSYNHWSLEEVIDWKERYGLGYVLMNSYTVEDAKKLKEAGLLVFVRGYPGASLPADFYGAYAENWLENLYTTNPYVDGFVIDWEMDTVTWVGDRQGKNMAASMKRISEEHGKLFGVQPHFRVAEDPACLNQICPEEWPNLTHFLLVWYYGGNPYSNAMKGMYNTWKTRTNKTDPNFPVLLEIAAGESNNGARPQTPESVREAITNLRTTTGSLCLFLGDLMLWDSQHGSNAAAFTTNLQTLNTYWATPNQSCSYN